LMEEAYRLTSISPSSLCLDDEETFRISSWIDSDSVDVDGSE
jgi:hypothetical protein